MAVEKVHTLQMLHNLITTEKIDDDINKQTRLTSALKPPKPPPQ